MPEVKQTPDAEKTRRTCIGCVVVMAVFLLVGLIASQFGSDEPDKFIEAYAMAEGYVEDFLKSPGTAEFGPRGSVEDRVSQAIEENWGKNTYRVTGWVDSQNALGATVRTRYSCVVENTDGADKWDVLYMVIKPQGQEGRWQPLYRNPKLGLRK